LQVNSVFVAPRVDLPASVEEDLDQSCSPYAAERARSGGYHGMVKVMRQDRQLLQPEFCALVKRLGHRLSLNELRLHEYHPVGARRTMVPAIAAGLGIREDTLLAVFDASVLMREKASRARESVQCASPSSRRGGRRAAQAA